MTSKIIYRGSSASDLFFSFIVRAGLIGLIIYLGFQYHENPAAVVFAGVLCFLIFSIIGGDETIIYSDRIYQSDDSLLSIMRITKGETIYLSDIRLASFPEVVESTPAEIATVILFRSLLPKLSRPKKVELPIVLTLKNGGSIHLVTGLGENRNSEVIRILNSLR